MRLSSAVLIGTTCTLAVSWIYFASRLHEAREHAQISATRIRDLSAQVAALRKEPRIPVSSESGATVRQTAASAPTRKFVAPQTGQFKRGPLTLHGPRKACRFA